MSSLGVDNAVAHSRFALTRPSAPLLFAALVFGVLLWSPVLGDTPLAFKSVLLLMCALAAAAPDDALLALSGLFPVAGILATLFHVPWRGADAARAIVVAHIVGSFAGLAFRARRTPTAAGSLAVVAAALVVCASAAVCLLDAAAAGSATDIAYGLGSILTGDYAKLPSGFEAVYAALDVLLALTLFCAVRWTIQQSTSVDARRVVRMLVVGVAAAALLNVSRLVEVSIAKPQPWMMARWYLKWMRINVQYGDMNAAGSVFGMMLLASIGLVRSATSWKRAVWALALAAIAAGLWLAGSRTAIAAALLVGGAAALVDARQWFDGRFGRLARAAALLGVSLLALFMLLKFPRTFANADAATAWETRMEMLGRGLRMLRDHPVFGVGIGRFMWESGRYATPGSFGPENAHNNYLQIAAELGSLGFAAFTAVFMAAVSGLRPSLLMNPCRLWMSAGLLVYLATAVSGHPLLVFEASIPFWIVAGILAPPPSPESRSRAGRMAFAALAVFVVVTFPFRVAASVRSLMQAPSAPPWHTDGELRYRDVGAADTIVISPPASYISVPLRLAGSNNEATVDVAVDGRAVNSVVVSSARWTDVRILFPKSRGYEDRRVTLRLRQGAGGRLLVGRVKLP